MLYTIVLTMKFSCNDNVKLISQAGLYDSSNKRKSINRLIDVFFREKNAKIKN